MSIKTLARDYSSADKAFPDKVDYYVIVEGEDHARCIDDRYFANKLVDGEISSYVTRMLTDTEANSIILSPRYIAGTVFAYVWIGNGYAQYDKFEAVVRDLSKSKKNEIASDFIGYFLVGKFLDARQITGTRRSSLLNGYMYAVCEIPSWDAKL